MSRPLVIQVKEKDKAAAAATAPTVPQPKPVAGLKSSGGAKATPKPMTLTSETSEQVLAVKPAPKPLPPKPAATSNGASSSSPAARPSVAGAAAKSPATDMNMARSQTSYAGSKAAAISTPASASPLARQTTAGAALQNGHGAASPSAATRPQPASAPDVRPPAPAHAHTQSSPNVTAAAPAKSAMKSSGDVGAHKGSTGARVTVAALPEKTSASASPSPSPHTSSYGSGAVNSRSSSKGGDGGPAPYGVGSSYAARRSMGLALNPAAAKATTALEFLQHQAAVTAWIEELTKAPLPNKEQTPSGFVAALADGVVLCRAMLAIDERSIPGINPTRTPMQIRDNLNNFLEACREIGVPDLNLFRLPDVLARANAVQVVECVYALALVCAKNGFKPALRDNTSTSFPAAATREAEALHTRFGRKGATSLDALLEADAARLEGRPNAPEKEAPLPAVPSHSTAALPPTPTSGSKPAPAPAATAATGAANAAPRRRAGPPPPVVRTDLLRLATPKTIKGITRLQAIVRGRAARTLFLQRRRGLAYRDRVAQEILATEQSYVAGLQTLTRLYIEPLEAAIRDGKPILSKEDVKTIFGNIQVILGVNSVLLKDMEPRIKAWGPQQCLGDIFLNICKFLKVYTQFIRDYSVIMATIASSLKQNKKFETFCKGAEREAKGYSLDSFLILPVQRIPRYILLLNELKKHTWPDHRDYKAVVEAWTQVQDVANYVNQKKKESEDLSKVLEIESKIEGVLKRELVEAHRKFVTELAVKVLKDKKKADRTLLVFNDLILVTKHTGDKYKLVDEINLDPKWSNAVTTKDGKDNSIALMNDMDVQLLAFVTEPPEKRTEVRDLLNRLRADFEERARASDAQATKRAQQKAEDFKHLVEASVEADSSASSEQLNQISRGGSIKMHPRRQHPEHVQKLKDELKKITPDMTKDLLSEERSFVKIVNLTLQESKKKGRARALFVCSDIALFVQPAKDQEKHPDEYKFLAQYQIMELSARDCSGPGEGFFAELVHGEGTSDTLGPFKFATEAERKSFVSDLASVRTALAKRAKETDAAKTAKAQSKAEGAKKAIGESYGKSKGDKAVKQIQEPKDGEESETAASATSNASEGGLRKWAQKKEEIKKAREASKK